MTKLSELFDLPEQTTASSFVVELSEALRDPTKLLDQYVVTEQLAQSFGKALHQVKEAVDSDDAVACYLHGSFGCGKSHFMAVMYALLQGHPDALKKRGLESVVQDFNPWLQDKKFLLVTYHMIGAASVESALLGGYADRVRELHPDARPPIVYKGDELIDDARNMQTRLGSAKFFEQLNEGASGGEWGDEDDWGEDTTWTEASFESAAQAPPGDSDRLRLLNALIDTFFTSYGKVVENAREAFVDLDVGISIITEHAKSLGYDGLVLFIDELILWLASHVTDTGFLEREGQKLAKLVESQHERSLPLVSFVARQKSLREFAGNQMLGSDQARVDELIKHWEGRFSVINLEDRNLPEIVAQRLLAPKNDAAQRILDEDFAKTTKVQQNILDELQTNEFEREHFRKLYPFSPALVQALVAVSSLLQRERTALKVLAELLVKRRDMELGGVIPVGDIYDEIASGNSPFAGDASVYFENTKKMYAQKLLPLIEEESGISKEDYDAGRGEPGLRRSFEGNDRLVKTLLLSALAPGTPALAELTAHKLVALNHGSIRHPIPGQEASLVLTRCRTWASRGTQIKVGSGDAPTISIQTEGVDVDPLIEKVAPVDTTGARLQLLRSLLYSQLGIATAGEVFDRVEFSYKGVKRTFEVLFHNVRKLSDDSLKTSDEQRRVIIDYPFDDEDHDIDDDRARLDRFIRDGNSARAVVWLPSFFSETSLRDLGILVRLEHLLTGDRLTEAAGHLSANDRAQAKLQLQGRADHLQARLEDVLMAAYGVREAVPGTLSETKHVSQNLTSLDPGTEIRPLVGASMRNAFESLMTQVLASQYPAHPDFKVPVTTTVMRKVWGVCRQALEDQDRRVLVDKSLRRLMSQVAEPAQLGTMGDTHFVVSRDWYDQFVKLGSEPSVGELRSLLDQPQARGLPNAVTNVVLMVYAAQADSTFTVRGGPFDAKIDKAIPIEVALAKVDLPNPAEWDAARALVGPMFGASVSGLCNATNVADLVSKVETVTHGHEDVCLSLAAKLDEVLTRLGLEPAECERSRTAHAVVSMLDRLRGKRDAEFVRALCAVKVDTSAESMGSSLKSAKNVKRELDGANWTIMNSLQTYEGRRKSEALKIVADLRDRLRSDEYAQPLMPELDKLEKAATDIIVAATPPPKGVVVETGEATAVELDRASDALRGVSDALAKHAGTSNLHFDLQWKIYSKSDKP